MIRTQKISNRFYAEVISDRTDVGVLGYIEVGGADLRDIEIVPAGYICEATAKVIYSGLDGTTPIFQSVTIRATIKNASGTISIVGSGSADSYGASGMSGPPEVSIGFITGTSGFGIEVDQTGAETTGNYASARIEVHGHPYDTGV